MSSLFLLVPAYRQLNLWGKDAETASAQFYAPSLLCCLFFNNKQINVAVRSRFAPSVRTEEDNFFRLVFFCYFFPLFF